MINTQQIARIAHEVNRAYCQSIGDDSQPSWDDAPEWQKESALKGVELHLSNPGATPEQSHESWLAQKEADGWKYGPVKNPETKEHPCFLPYAELPAEQKAKDYLFRQVVHSLAALANELYVVPILSGQPATNLEEEQPLWSKVQDLANAAKDNKAAHILLSNCAGSLKRIVR